MDCRVDIYGAGLLTEYYNSRRSVNDFNEYLKKYSVNIVLLQSIFKDINNSLAGNPGWELVSATRHYFFFVKKGRTR
jgi:hypothetical protein